MTKIMKHGKIKLLLVILWMLVIFMMSHLNATKSWLLTGKILVSLENVTSTSEEKIDVTSMDDREELSLYSNKEMAMYLLRKAAHVIEFFVLALLVSLLLMDYRSKRDQILITFLWGVAYAAFDEFHQLFIAGRTANPKDIAIDSIGVVLGILLFQYMINKVKRYKVEV